MTMKISLLNMTDVKHLYFNCLLTPIITALKVYPKVKLNH